MQQAFEADLFNFDDGNDRGEDEYVNRHIEEMCDEEGDVQVIENVERLMDTETAIAYK